MELFGRYVRPHVSVEMVVVLIAILLIAILACQQAPTETAIAKESPPPFVIEPGVQYPVSQFLEEQNRKGVFMLPLVESHDGKYQIPAVRNIYFSQRLGDKTTVMITGISEPFTVIEIILYDASGKVIHKETVASQPYPPVPREASYAFFGKYEKTQILDWRLLALIPVSKFEEAEMISIDYL